MFTDNIVKPTLIIDLKKVETNIDKMLKKAEMSKAVFRPHFKTHQSLEIASVFRSKGVDKITVSSVDMAKYFAAAGWDDITIAFPLNLREIDDVNNLSKEISLNLLIESSYVATILSENLKYTAGVFIKIDTGYHRTGLLADDLEIPKIIEIVRKSDNLAFKGFLTHAGHTYIATGKTEIVKVLKSAKVILTDLKNRYKHMFENVIISYGDTPSCSIANDCVGFDEIRPGNFVYYDIMQYHIGSCSLDKIAVAVACPVVAIHKERDELVIYGGAVHLSKEFVEVDNGFKIFGYVVNFSENGWGEVINDAYVASVSQEHGIIKMPAKILEGYNCGDIVGVLPVHSCLTADLVKYYKII
jgi:D-serine deaminase-like pyridoxal phosphate-dependent protein